MDARAKVINSGLKSITPIRVAGSEPANMTTPIKPYKKPSFVFVIFQYSLILKRLNDIDHVVRIYNPIQFKVTVMVNIAVQFKK